VGCKRIALGEIVKKLLEHHEAIFGIVCSITLITLTIIICTAIISNNKKEIEFAKSGLEQTLAPGTRLTVWQKVERN
jgi:hypothetical protein